MSDRQSDEQDRQTDKVVKKSWTHGMLSYLIYCDVRRRAGGGAPGLQEECTQKRRNK